MARTGHIRNRKQDHGAVMDQKIISRRDAISAGLTRYFTGKPCRKGHVSVRGTSGGSCIACRGYLTTRTDQRKLAIEEGMRRYFTGMKCRRGHIAERFTITGICVECSKENNIKHKEKGLIATKKWQSKNNEHIREVGKKYRQANPHKMRAAVARRWAEKLKATPIWADHEKIAEIYSLAIKTGKHVDHIIPLRGKLVCGLHVHNNLQPLDPIANKRKGNSVDLGPLGWGV